MLPPATRRHRPLAALAAAVCLVGSQVLVQAATSAPAAAIPSLSTVTNTLPTNSTGIKALNVHCPSGTNVIGGGGSITGNHNNKVFLTQLIPWEDGTFFVVSAAEMAPGWDGNWGLTGYAICAAGLSGYTVVRGDSGGDVATYKTTYTRSCPKHEKVFGVGGAVFDANGQVGLTLVRPDGPLTIGRASARVAPGGFWGNWSVQSYAICAFPVPGQQNVGSSDNASRAFADCPSGTSLNGMGGGGGLVDLGPYYLRSIAPNGNNTVRVDMTGTPNGGMVAQATCSE
jgi:hypothetical protein